MLVGTTYAVKAAESPEAILWHGDDWYAAVAWARTQAQENGRRYQVFKLVEVTNVGPTAARFL